MKQTHGVLDYISAPRPANEWGRRAARVILLSAGFAVARAVLGALLGFGSLLFRPSYSSWGTVWIQGASWEQDAALYPPLQAQLPPVVAAALKSARQSAAGKSLPSSATAALKHCTIAYGHSEGGLVHIGYVDANRNAAACMAHELVGAYAKSAAASNSGPGVSVTILGQQTIDTSPRWLPLLGGVLGGFLGALLAWAVSRFSSPKPSEALPAIRLTAS
jgi:hypothetical protein